MEQKEHCKIRLRLPSGAEIETEGREDFVREEFNLFLGLFEQESKRTPSRTPPESEAIWKEIVEADKKGLVLKSKPTTGSSADACLLLLGAARAILGLNKPAATQLARWLRRSGCPIQRLDRILNEAVNKGEILAYGFKRSRKYELTPTGMQRSGMLALQLATRQ